MAANTAPIFTLTPNIAAVAIGGAANTRSDGVGTIATDMFKVLTAGTAGAQVDEVRLHPVASVASTPTAATVHRIYISSKAAGATTQADTWLFAEVAAAAQTADDTAAATSPIVVPIGKVLPAGYTILVSSHAANAANTGWTATAFGGDF